MEKKSILSGLLEEAPAWVEGEGEDPHESFSIPPYLEDNLLPLLWRPLNVGICESGDQG